MRTVKLKVDDEMQFEKGEYVGGNRTCEELTLFTRIYDFAQRLERNEMVSKVEIEFEED